jgi:hypothetical protein
MPDGVGLYLFAFFIWPVICSVSAYYITISTVIIRPRDSFKPIGFSLAFLASCAILWLMCMGLASVIDVQLSLISQEFSDDHGWWIFCLIYAAMIGATSYGFYICYRQPSQRQE